MFGDGRARSISASVHKGRILLVFARLYFCLFPFLGVLVVACLPYKLGGGGGGGSGGGGLLYRCGK